MSKTVSSRIPKDLHDKLRQRCDKEGCNPNDFIKMVLEFELEQKPKEQKPNPKDPSTWKSNKKPLKPQVVTICDSEAFHASSGVTVKAID